METLEWEITDCNDNPGMWKAATLMLSVKVIHGMPGRGMIGTGPSVIGNQCYTRSSNEKRNQLWYQ